MHQIRTPEYDSRRPRNISESLTAAYANSVLNALTAQTAKAVDRNISRSAGQTPTIVHIDAIAVISLTRMQSPLLLTLWPKGQVTQGKLGLGPSQGTHCPPESLLLGAQLEQCRKMLREVQSGGSVKQSNRRESVPKDREAHRPTKGGRV